VQTSRGEGEPEKKAKVDLLEKRGQVSLGKEKRGGSRKFPKIRLSFLQIKKGGNVLDAKKSEKGSRNTMRAEGSISQKTRTRARWGRLKKVGKKRNILKKRERAKREKNNYQKNNKGGKKRKNTDGSVEENC